jgi:primase-polymerase (primpol)-like protein
VFSPDDPYCGVDFDGCLDGGGLAEWARPWIEQLADCYMEVSPSGRGIKVWCRAKLPGIGGKRTVGGDHAGIEVYDQGRYFAFTGNVWRTES